MRISTLHAHYVTGLFNNLVKFTVMHLSVHSINSCLEQQLVCSRNITVKNKLEGKFLPD